MLALKAIRLHDAKQNDSNQSSVQKHIEQKIIIFKIVKYKTWHVMCHISVRLGDFGLADCYAAKILADNATFLLAVNCGVAFRTQAANRPHIQWKH